MAPNPNLLQVGVSLRRGLCCLLVGLIACRRLPLELMAMAGTASACVGVPSYLHCSCHPALQHKADWEVEYAAIIEERQQELAAIAQRRAEANAAKERAAAEAAAAAAAIPTSAASLFAAAQAQQPSAQELFLMMQQQAGTLPGMPQ